MIRKICDAFEDSAAVLVDEVPLCKTEKRKSITGGEKQLNIK